MTDRMTHREESLSKFRLAVTAETSIKRVFKDGGLPQESALAFMEAVKSDISATIEDMANRDSAEKEAEREGEELAKKEPVDYGLSSTQAKDTLTYAKILYEQGLLARPEYYDVRTRFGEQAEIAAKREKESKEFRIGLIEKVSKRVRVGLALLTVGGTALSLGQLAVGYQDREVAMTALKDNPSYARSIQVGSAVEVIDDSIYKLTPSSWYHSIFLRYPSAYNSRDRLEEADRGLRGEVGLIATRRIIGGELTNAARRETPMYTSKKDPFFDEREKLESFRDAVVVKQKQHSDNVPQELRKRESDTADNLKAKGLQLLGVVVVGAASMFGVKRAKKYLSGLV